MRYSKIRKMDISNGPGVRVSIFMQGCDFHCPQCFNPETHDFEGGEAFDDAIIDKVLEAAKLDYIVGLSILGGEPMHPKNIDGTLKLVKAFKDQYPQKTVWVWTGFLFEQLKNKKGIENIDVLVDGQYKDELHDFRLKWKGSSNQRVIDIKKTLENNEIVIFE